GGQPVASLTVIPVASIVPAPGPPPLGPGETPSVSGPLALDSAGTLFFYGFDYEGPYWFHVVGWSIPEQRYLPEQVGLRSQPTQTIACDALGGLLFNFGAELRVLPRGASRDRHWRNLESSPVIAACDGSHVFVARRIDGT